jgi:hypothetical protein
MLTLCTKKFRLGDLFKTKVKFNGLRKFLVCGIASIADIIISLKIYLFVAAIDLLYRSSQKMSIKKEGAEAPS